MATTLLSAADIDTDDLAAIVTGPDAKAATPARAPRRNRQPRSQRKPAQKMKRGRNAS